VFRSPLPVAFVILDGQKLERRGSRDVSDRDIYFPKFLLIEENFVAGHFGEIDRRIKSTEGSMSNSTEKRRKLKIGRSVPRSPEINGYGWR